MRRRDDPALLGRDMQPVQQPRHRWPTTSTDPGHPPAPETGPHQPTDDELREAMGDLAGAIRSIVPVVLSSETWLLDSNGQAGREYRVPFRSLAVWSFSAQRLTIANGPKGSSTPQQGPGVGVIPINGFRVLNLAGHAWAIYGGTQGDVVCVEAYGLPMPPAAAKLV
jgi:hypothetical protein